MAQPTYFPDWATSNTNLPATNNVNKVRPKTTLRTIGWDLGELPSAEEWNWQLNNVGLWIHYLNDEVIGNLPNVYLPKNGTTLNFTGDITGTATWGGNNTTSVELSSATLSSATSSATANTLVKRNGTGGASFAAITTTDITSNTITNSGTLVVGGSSSVAAITTTAAQGGGINALTRKDYVDGIQTTLQNNINVLASTVAATYVQGVRLGTEYSKTITADTPIKANSGGVSNGWYYEGDNPSGDTIYFRPIQYNINGTWFTVGQI